MHAHQLVASTHIELPAGLRVDVVDDQVADARVDVLRLGGVDQVHLTTGKDGDSVSSPGWRSSGLRLW